MLNRSASLAMSTSVLKALPGKLDIKRHSPSILYVLLILMRQLQHISFVSPGFQLMNKIASASKYNLPTLRYQKTKPCDIINTLVVSK